MSHPRITRFNAIMNNRPNLGADHEYWSQIRLQAALILEEAKELYEAAMEEDAVGVLDGFLDVRYTNEYMEDILQAGDVDTKKSWDEVQISALP